MSKWYPCIYCTEDLHCTKYSDDDSESWCVLGPCTAETPSNGDKIRRMTDEELAHLLHSAEEHLFTGNLWNYEKWTEWLKQEAT